MILLCLIEINPFVDFFLDYHYLVPLKNGGSPYLIKLEFPSSKNAFCQVLVDIDPVIIEKMSKMWKVYDNDNEVNDDDRQQR